MPETAESAPPDPVRILRQGQGVPLVLVHGYLGGAAMWNRQLADLGTQFDVIAPELPGYGDSAGQPAAVSIAGYAQQVLGALDRLNIPRFHLLGHSMGGMIAQQIAASNPDRVDQLICYGTGPQGVLPDRFEPIAQSRARLKTDGVPATARRIAANWFVNGAQARDFGDCVAVGAQVSEQAALAGLDAMEGWDGRAALTGIAQKTLVIWGDRDRSYGWSQPHQLWTGITGASLAVMPGCGHNAHQEQPTLFNTIVANFLLGRTEELSA